ncbi:MAG: hypothetical protein ABW213_15675 [Tardiphaga sp.]
MTEQPFEARPGFSSHAASDHAGRPSHDLAEAFVALVDRASERIEQAKAPGKSLDRLATLTRKAPLTCLAVAFLVGIVTTRRR